MPASTASTSASWGTVVGQGVAVAPQFAQGFLEVGLGRQGQLKGVLESGVIVVDALEGRGEPRGLVEQVTVERLESRCR